MTSIVIETGLGTMEIALEDERAPKTVASFLRYLDEGHYAGTIFHRVIPGFMAQGGGYDARYEKKPVHAPVPNEADNGLKNLRGTIAMARTSDPHSATAQFFVNVADNARLDHTAKDDRGWGYAVFGRLTSGLEVADRMVAVKTGAQGPFSKDAPLTLIAVTAARRR